MNCICFTINLNIIGLILVFIGTTIALAYSPLNFHTIDGGSAHSDSKKDEKKTKRNNFRMIFGICLILIGTLAQILSNMFNI